ncbi:HAD family phosphatase [Arthrobacter sp.]|uniref:HAD family hydrolase n=1 Tax=Arthrobacter sp. TaxID=1667 RepID=UPI00289BEBF1|nr:HAD family phosphatase [Arthrobacter sp.]
MTPVPALQAVFWDMDGTLVDTEPYWFAAEKELMARFGVRWSDEQAMDLVGNALPDTAAKMQAAGADLGVREILDALLASVVRSVRQEIPWRPGARELLAELGAAGVPCAMVTMSETILAKEIAEQLPAGTFRFLVTGEMVTLGKPDPEPYLLAAKLMGEELGTDVDLDRAIAVEDSLPGVASAKASGAVTVAVPNAVDVPEQPGITRWETLAGRTVADLDALVAERAALRV